MTRRMTANTYTSPAPVFAGIYAEPEVIGQAKTARGALLVYRRFYDGSWTASKAVKAKIDVPGMGAVDGWVPKFML